MDEKKAWLVMVGALAFSMVIYVAVGWFVLQATPPPEAPDFPALPASAVAGVLLLGVAAALARVAAAPGNPPFRFRALSILALVTLEAGAVVGLVFTLVSRRMEPLLVLAAAGLVGVAAFVVPAGNAYFRDRVGPRPGAPPLGPS